MESFKKVDSSVDFPELERRILSYWKRAGVITRYLRKNTNAKKRFRFLDGPITANNPMGVHHAWGRSYKDLFQRYKNMRGFRQRFQNGFDCQGLWIEVEVEKELGFRTKKDIEKFGLANFSRACRERVRKYSRVQTNQSLRLGYFMDWDNSYYTYTDKNVEYIWYFLKECYKKGWLYKDFRSLPWCVRCGTSLSQHELFDSYKELTHSSVFLKFPVKGKRGEYFLVWTTTPWTLVANVALAVNPCLVYVRVQVGKGIFILAKKLLSSLDGGYRVLEEFSGSRLVGLRYDSPFAELPVQRNTQKVLLPWDGVSEEEGTGIVHIAPGCGEEDFELGRKHMLDILVPIDGSGNYIEGYGFLSGEFVHSVDNKIFESLRKKDLIYKVDNYTHRYPICWRCKAPIAFRAEENWFISAGGVRSKMIREARKVKWHPSHVGKLMEDWLNNMGDWNISRKRYFGLPLPFYECRCGETTVVGSKKELRELATDPEKVDKLPELHRPWVDGIKVRCPKCGREAERILDVGDCWLDAGIVPFSTLNYLENRRYWRQWFPADWISEMREQVRLWFYSLLFMAVTLEGKTPYREVLSYEKLYDEKGEPMHKSAGNVIWFDEAVERMGADTIRWMYFNHDPASNICFGYGPADVIRRRFFLILWNCYKFFVDYANADKFNVKSPLNTSLGNFGSSELTCHNVLDRWINSRLNWLIAKVEELLDGYDAMSASRAIEEFVVRDLSQWYIRRSRSRFGPAAKDLRDKKVAYVTLYNVLLTLSKLLAPFVPFVAEEIYLNLSRGQSFFGGKGNIIKGRGDSVHLVSWPKYRSQLVDECLISDMEKIREITEHGHSLRKSRAIKLRQPLACVKVRGFPGFRSGFSRELTSLIAEELNVKRVVFKSGGRRLSLKFDTKLTKKLVLEGQAREMIRNIQDMRKKKNIGLGDKIGVTYPGSGDNKQVVEMFGDLIKEETLASVLRPGKSLSLRRLGR